MLGYPTTEHREAAEAIVEHVSRWPEVEAILLTCSCARGKASRDSCLDLAVLTSPGLGSRERRRLEARWERLNASLPQVECLSRVGAYTQVDLDFTDGRFTPGDHGWTSGPDSFELEIGNTLVYVVPLWERGNAFAELQARWLPYYGEELRAERLAMVRRCCLNNLDHIPLYVRRGLYFQAFNRLYHALGEFLQALFICRRTYPIAYDKWIREQIEEILDLPELYPELPWLLEIHDFESDAVARKGQRLRALLERYVA